MYVETVTRRQFYAIQSLNRKGEILTHSSKIYPDHPQVAVGAIVFKNDRVLLVRRGQSPSEGLWAIPGGSVELGETLQEATEREIFEESGLTIKAKEPVFTFDFVEHDDTGRIRYHYVIVDLLADYVTGEPRPGDDVTEARWVSSQEMQRLEVSPKTLELLREHFGFGI